MNLDRVSSANNVPNKINVIIEIPSHADPVKYELDKNTGAIFVDRFMSTAMHCKTYRNISSHRDLPEELLNQISHFCEHYKDLDEGKWVRVDGWGGIDEAKQENLDSVKLFNESPEKPDFYVNNVLDISVES
jgi:inorganic pyrophosphatase